VPEAMEAFESWFFRYVAQAVEADEVSDDLLIELRMEMERARELPQEEGHALAVQDIARSLGLPVNQAEEMLTALEAQPTVTREEVLRRIVEEWLAARWEQYVAGRPPRKSDGRPRAITRAGGGREPARAPPRVPSPMSAQ